MSYLIDTNVISELNRPLPNANVVRWLNAHPTAFISTVTKAEVLYGVENLDEGKRKRQLAIATQEILALFDGRILVFCEQSANFYGKIIVQREKQGKPISVTDALIASIALANDLTVVTHNVRDFVGIDNLRLFNPFD